MTRESILASAGLPEPQPVEIPEWGGGFRLLPLNGAQVEEISLLVEQARATGNYGVLKGLRGRVATWVVADADGKPVFKPTDAQTLTEKFPGVLQRIFEAVKSHNLLDAGAAGAIEKNS